MRKLSITFFLLLFLSVSFGFAQGGNVILIKGTVTDGQTGKPAAVTLMFVSEKGKRIPAKVNSADGSYQQVLTPGETYSVSVKEYIVPENQRVFTLGKSDTYSETVKDFRLQRIAPGMNLMEFNAFRPNDTALVESNANQLTALKDFLSNNIKVNVEILVSTQDSYFKPAKKTITVQEKKKTKKKTKTISSEEQLKALAEARINAIKDYLAVNKIPVRNISFREDIKSSKASSAKTAKKKSKKGTDVATNQSTSVSTIKVTITKVIDMN